MDVGREGDEVHRHIQIGFFYTLNAIMESLSLEIILLNKICLLVLFVLFVDKGKYETSAIGEHYVIFKTDSTEC